MANTIKIKNSGTGANVPSAASLQYGELALNYVDGKLYFKTGASTVDFLKSDISLGTDTTGSYVSSLVAGTGITLTNNSGEGSTPTIAVTTNTFQSLDADLTAIAALAGTSGLLKKTAANTWSLDTDTYLTSGTVVTTVNGASGVISNVALTTATLSQFAATTSAELLGVISDETGTGSLVFANSPALVTPTGIVKGDVGLSSVDNTADTAKPVSTAQQTALNLKANIASPTFTGTVGGITKTMVGLGNVDNTADTAKPVSTAQQTALNLKANLASPTFTGTPTLPTGTIATTQTAGNSSTKVATTAFVTTANNLKANLASPTFTGTVTIPSGASISGFAPLASPALTGTPTAPTATAATNSTQIATTAYADAAVAALVDASPAALNTLNELAAALGDDASFSTTVATSIGLKANIASPTFTGTVTSPTFNATSTANGGFQGIDADTAILPSFTWTSDQNTGIWHAAADSIGFTTGGTNRITLNSAGISGAGAGLTGLNGTNISSGTVAAARVATLNQKTNGSAAKWTTARTITLAGDLTGNVSIDGSSNVTLTATAPTAPIGSVVMWAGTTANIPAGYAVANGAFLSTTTYAALYAIIGTRYGALSNSTFPLPNFTSNVPEGITGVPGASATKTTSASSAVDTHTHSVNSTITNPGAPNAALGLALTAGNSSGTFVKGNSAGTFVKGNSAGTFVKGNSAGTFTAGNSSGTFTAGNAASHSHLVSGVTTNASANHNHGGTTGNATASHTHTYFKPNAGANNSTGTSTTTSHAHSIDTSSGTNHAHNMSFNSGNAGPAVNSTWTAGAVNSTWTAGVVNSTWNAGAVNSTWNAGAVNSTFSSGNANTHTHSGAVLTAGNASTINASTVGHTHTTSTTEIIFIIRVS